MRLKRLAGLFGCRLADEYDREVSGITCNSREVKEGYIFVAIEGSERDGGEFIGDAISKGAIAVVSNKEFSCAKDGLIKIICQDPREAAAELAHAFYNHPSSLVDVIGVTGTNGKTTTTYLLKNILEKAGFGTGVIGTIDYNLKGKHIAPSNTTPGPVQLAQLLSLMAEEGLRYAVMEVTSHALVQKRVHKVKFKAAVFTNLTRDHLDYHVNFENYFDAKSLLFRQLGAGSVALINADDKWSARLAERIKEARVITYAINNAADFKAEDIALSLDGMRFSVRSPQGILEFNSRLIGVHNVYNVLAAAAAALSLGIEAPFVRKGVDNLVVVPGRLERVDAGQDFHIFVDYAHTDDALKNVLSLLKGLSKANLIAVFGCGGDRDKTKRPLMGLAASELADYAILTSDNPRSEEPREIIREIEAGIKNGARYEVCVDRRDAIERALALAGPQDIVLIAGKGHETYQIFKANRIPFDDREVAREAVCRALK